MIPFIALVWNDDDPSGRHAARQLEARIKNQIVPWRLALNQSGCLVFSRAHDGIDTLYTLADARGVILGRLFQGTSAHNGTSPACVSCPIDSRIGASLLSSGGRALADTFWGRYVAFFVDKQAHTTWILRDPTGGIACHRIQIGPVHVYFSRLEDIDGLLTQSLTINERYVISQVTIVSAHCEQTGLNEVTTILAGQRATHSLDNFRTDFFWNPLAIAQAGRIDDVAEAQKILRHTAEACVHAWSSCYDGVALRLSGGLDSSIIAACLASAPSRPKIICKNVFDDGPSSDERSYARLVAERYHFPLIEIADTKIYSLQHGLELPRALAPPSWIGDLESTRRTAVFNQAEGLSVEMTGTGGDEIFYRFASEYDAVDYAQLHGLRPELFSVAMNDAIVDQVSIWRVLRRALPRAFKPRPRRLLDLRGAQRPALVRDDVALDAINDDLMIHPLFRGTQSLPPCKLEQAYHICLHGEQVYLPPIADYRPTPVLSPLLSQPLMEVCLRIPVYVLRKGGMDRALTRYAFEDALPPEITYRTHKSFGTPHLQKVLLGNLGVARALLLDGYLVRHGILDRSKVEAALAGLLPNSSYGAMELASYLIVEGWAHAWCGAQMSAAA